MSHPLFLEDFFEILRYDPQFFACQRFRTLPNTVIREFGGVAQK